MDYRPEIDGLRALAVAAVILFHAGVSGFSGGFVGVDVFFVISGYLITSLIAKDIEAGTFSLAAFYERRARRILPALFVVLLCCMPFAWMWMSAGELKDFSRSVVAVCSFVSNIFFWRQTGYFGDDGQLMPLLHTWSLGVEEQFYILFPVAVLMLWRLPRLGVILSIALVTLLSLALAQYAAQTMPTANFFLLPTRTWELTAGALCALAAYRPDRRQGNLLSVLGVVGIGASVLAYDEMTPFPSLYALLPVLGACFVIIGARSGTVVCRVLSLSPCVGLGLVSYSAYLWHQPLLAFARLQLGDELSPVVTWGLVSACIVLAYLTWRFVEVPARQRGRWPLPSRTAVFAASTAVAASFIAVGGAGYFTAGFPDRWGPEIARLEARTVFNRGLAIECEEGFSLSPNCRTGERPEVLLWGDSYAMHLADGLKASAPLTFIQHTKARCGPFMGIAPISATNPLAWAKQCLQFNDQVIDYARRTKSLKFAVLSSPFSQFVGENARVLTRDGKIVRGQDVAMASFRRTLDMLVELGIQPIIVAPPPSPGFDAGRCVLRAAKRGVSSDVCSFSLKAAIDRRRAVVDFLNAFADHHAVVWLDAAICQADTCSARKDGVFIYADAGHLSHEGSAYIGRAINFGSYLLYTAAIGTPAK